MLAEYSIQRPRTRAECRDEARPCPWVSCEYHLLLEVANVSATATDRRPPTIRLNRPAMTSKLGRRPGLRAGAAEHAVRCWIDDAVAALSLMPFTCELDVIDAYPDGLPPGGIARLLGTTRPAVQADIGRALANDDVREQLAKHRGAR